MGTTPEVAKWPTSDGQMHEFGVYTIDASWKKVGGVYIFTYADGQRWHPLYVGETEDFSVRLPAHERWQEAVRLGATHVHARSETQRAKREDLEQRLIRDHKPPLNERLR